MADQKFPETLTGQVPVRPERPEVSVCPVHMGQVCACEDKTQVVLPNEQDARF